MKKLLSLILIISNISYAECDFSTGIKKVDDGYLYTTECHLKVGSLVKDNKNKDESIGQLNKAIDLKDLALTKADQRVQLWTDTSEKLETRVNTISELQNKNYFLYFGLGIVTTGLAVWGASKLR